MSSQVYNTSSATGNPATFTTTITPTGEAGKDSFYVSDGTLWYELNHYEYFKVKKRQNQVKK